MAGGCLARSEACYDALHVCCVCRPWIRPVLHRLLLCDDPQPVHLDAGETCGMLPEQWVKLLPGFRAVQGCRMAHTFGHPMFITSEAEFDRSSTSLLHCQRCTTSSLHAQCALAKGRLSEAFKAFKVTLKHLFGCIVQLGFALDAFGQGSIRPSSSVPVAGSCYAVLCHTACRLVRHAGWPAL
jgi:hypothetical protein